MNSMTGFGSGASRARGAKSGRIVVEIRGVNQRFLDLKLALPREYLSLEAELRRLVQERVARGRVEVTVSRAGRDDRPARIEIDEGLARAYVTAWRDVKRRLALAGEVELSFLQGRDDLYRRNESQGAPEGEWPALRRALEWALRQFEQSRRREGRHLQSDMRRRVRALGRLAARMPGRAQASLVETRRRIEERMRELLGGGADPARIVQEAAFQAERSDVSEEIVRLESHLAGLQKLFASPEPAGRRFEFLLQEVQREVGTVASKSNDLELTRLAVEAKGEIERLREQVQNVE